MSSQQLEIVPQDTPCRPCGYNLRGLSPRGKCPECGGDIQDTLRWIREEAANRRDLGHVLPKSLNYQRIEPISFALSAALAWEPILLVLLLVKLICERARLRKIAALENSSRIGG